VYVLAAGTFLMLTTEFVVAGLLPEIAGDLQVSVAQAGLLITVFAAGMIVSDDDAPDPADAAAGHADSCPRGVRVRTPGRAAQAFRAGANLAPERAVGRRTWGEFLVDRVPPRR
jgi:hypothetical protein